LDLEKGSPDFMFVNGSFSELITILEYQLGIHGKPMTRQPSKDLKLDKPGWVLILSKPNVDRMLPFGK
jgi:hypothetical protein